MEMLLLFLLPSFVRASHSMLLSALVLCSLSFYRGRGAFESLGAGLDMREGDIAFKV